MKMRKKKHLSRASKSESDLQKYFFRKVTPEEIDQWEEEALAKAIERATKWMETTNEEFKRQLEVAKQWSEENPDAFEGVLCGPTKKRK